MNKVVLQTLAHAACPNVSEGLRHRLLKTAYHEVMLPASKKVAICDGYECSTVRSSVHVASEIVTYEYGTLTVSVLSVSAINVDPRVADLTVCESLKCSLRQIVWCVNTGVQISQRISVRVRSTTLWLRTAKVYLFHSHCNLFINSRSKWQRSERTMRSFIYYRLFSVVRKMSILANSKSRPLSFISGFGALLALIA